MVKNLTIRSDVVMSMSRMEFMTLCQKLDRIYAALELINDRVKKIEEQQKP